jgi:hypothetical protein
MVDLTTLRRMNDALASLDPWSLSDEELEAAIIRLRRQRNRCLVELERLQAELAARGQRRETRQPLAVP